MTKFKVITLQQALKRILRALPEINPDYVKSQLECHQNKQYTIPEVNSLINSFERDLYDSH